MRLVKVKTPERDEIAFPEGRRWSVDEQGRLHVLGEPLPSGDRPTVATFDWGEWALAYKDDPDA